jgi:hypothetical protein
MGWLKTVTGRFTAGQAMLGLTMLVGSALALCIRHDPEAERLLHSTGPHSLLSTTPP